MNGSETGGNGALYFNPSAGNTFALEEKIRDLLEPSGIEFVKIVPDLEIAEDIRARQTRGERLFVAAGGDGTIFHLVQALANTDSVLGIVPLGTFNHLASDLRIPEDWRQALEVALDGRERYVDIGNVNGLYFANNISLGLYPEVVEKRERMRAMIGKWIAYPLALFSSIYRLPKLSMTIEAPPHLEVVRTRLFFVSVNPYNLSHLGVIAPRESLQAGTLAAYWLGESLLGWKLFRALLRYARGKATKIETLRRFHTEALKVRSSRKELRVGIDGELIELEPPLEIRVERSGLLVRVPAES